MEHWDIDFTSPSTALTENRPGLKSKLSTSKPRSSLLSRLESATLVRDTLIESIVERLRTRFEYIQTRSLQLRRENLFKLVARTRELKEKMQDANNRRRDVIKSIQSKCHSHNDHVQTTILLHAAMMLQRRISLSQNILKKQVLAAKRRELILQRIVERNRFISTIKVLQAFERRLLMRRVSVDKDLSTKLHRFHEP
ncbi:hypothetical protein RCL1_001098 [Eukaryota sp. TZLM3-RCL]